MSQDSNGEKLATDSPPASAAAEAQPQEEVQLETAVADAAAPATPAVLEDDSEGFWERLRIAIRGFLRGWRGLPVEIPPGEEGTVPIVEAAATQRKLEKKLAKSAAAAEKLRTELDQKKQEIAELNTAQKELQRELKRSRSAAEEAEEQLRKDLEKERETVQALEATIGKLESDLSERNATIAGQDSSVGELKHSLEQAQRAAGEKEDATRRETDQLRGALDERGATLAKAQESLTEQQARGDRLAADLRDVRAQLEKEQAESLRRMEETQPQLTNLRMELAAREDALTELRDKMAQSESASAQAIAELRQEADTLKQSLAQRGTELENLGAQLKAQEAQSGSQLADAARRQEELRAEVNRWQIRNAETDAASDKLKNELAALGADLATLDEVRRKGAHTERELVKKSEEADLLREDLIAHRRRVVELEANLKGAEDNETQRGAFQRELQRQAVQLETLREQFSEAQVRLGRIEAALKEFHGPAVSAIQVAGVYAESVAGSLALSDSDRADIIEIKQNMDQLRQILQKLAAKMSELGISYS